MLTIEPLNPYNPLYKSEKFSCSELYPQKGVAQVETDMIALCLREVNIFVVPYNSVTK